MLHDQYAHAGYQEILLIGCVLEYWRYIVVNDFGLKWLRTYQTEPTLYSFKENKA